MKNLKMKTRYLKSLSILLLFLFISLSSCLSENFEKEIQIPEENNEYEGIILNVPMALGANSITRGTTNSDGFSSEGQYPALTNENIMDEFFLFFRAWNEETESYENKFYLHSTQRVDFNNIKDVTSDYVIIPIEVSLDNLMKIAGNDNVQIFLIGNVPQNILQYQVKLSETSYANLINNFNPDAFIYNSRNFGNLFKKLQDGDEKGFTLPIVNKSICKVTGFKDLDKDKLTELKNNTTNSPERKEELMKSIQHTLNMVFYGKDSDDYLDLERACARIDIADGCPREDGIYPVNYTDSECPIFARLYRITPSTFSNQFYIFRHIGKGDANGAFYNKDGNAGFEISLLGSNGIKDDGNNWIIDSDAEYKLFWEDDGKEGQNSNDNLKDHFYCYPYKDDVSTMETNSFLGYDYPDYVFTYQTNLKWFYEETNYHYIDENDPKGKIYFPWRYVPENTLPSQVTTRMTNTTAIRFSFRIWDAENDISMTPVRARELANELELKGEDYPYKISIVDGDYNPYLNQLEDNVMYLTINDETIRISYDRIWGGYMLHYLYYIHHNYDKTNPEETRAMKYGVVRNNLYRVSVTGLNGLPRPYIPKELLEPEPTFDIDVDFEILKWGVRSDENIILE